MRVCARARLARAPSPHSMSPTHFHGASAPPRHPRLAQPRAGPAPPPSGPPSLSRAPINQPRARRPLPLPLQLRAPARAPASGLSGSATVRYPSAARGWERAHPHPGGTVAAPPQASDCAPRRQPAAVQESPGASPPPPKRGILIASGPRASDAALSRELFPVGDPLHQWCCMQFQKLVSLSFPNTLVPI